jgi:type VII secretion effector (TIGR04197 family)
MPRVYRQKKSNRGRDYYCGRAGCREKILPGETYYSFTKYDSATEYRCFRHYPRQSELTGSDKLSRLYAESEAIEDAVSDFREGKLSAADLLSQLESSAGEVRDVGEEYQDSLSNMEEISSDGPVQEGIQEKMEQCEEYAQSLEDKASELQSQAEEYDNMDDDVEPEGTDDEVEVEYETPKADLRDGIADEVDGVGCPF